MAYKDKEKQRAFQRRWFHKRKDIIAALKAQPCMDCGGTFPPECMDFDHLRDKKFQISQSWNRRLDVLIEEISKCDPVCANCHRIRTKKRNTVL